MAGKASEAKKIKFAIEEIILSFIGALVLTFGIVVTVAGGVPNFVLGVFILWLGLLLFTVPLIRKVEQLM